MPTAINAFQATGIWPCDSIVFTDADFIAAATTDIYGTNVLPTENLERSNGNTCVTENQGRLEAQVHESDSPNTLQFGSIKEGTRSSSPKNYKIKRTKITPARTFTSETIHPLPSNFNI
ncbi:hypothetical protein JTB14_035967 [Gonioctena quinquepunctata]|nr:hypothetical protein JTB14_035967 [Gonioctena quinquepunctata]